MKEILHKPDVTTQLGRRDLVMLSILYDTGARVQELADLTVSSIRLEYPAHIRLLGKGRKYRNVPILPRTTHLLENYLSENNLIGNEKLECCLFANRQNHKLTRAGISYILSKYSKNYRTVNDTEITPHVLRHTKAMHLLQAGVSLVYIKDILGHVDINTTEIYARVNLEMKREALEKVAVISPIHAPIWTTNKNLLDWLNDISKQK